MCIRVATGSTGLSTACDDLHMLFICQFLTNHCDRRLAEHVFCGKRLLTVLADMLCKHSCWALHTSWYNMQCNAECGSECHRASQVIQAMQAAVFCMTNGAAACPFTYDLNCHLQLFTGRHVLLWQSVGQWCSVGQMMHQTA